VVKSSLPPDRVFPIAITNRTDATQKGVEGVNGGVNGGVNRLLEYIREHPGMRSSELTKAVSMPRRTLERHLKVLKEKNFVHFMGAPKTGGYYPREEERP